MVGYVRYPKSSKSYADETKRGVHTLDDRNREQLQQRSSDECGGNAADDINTTNGLLGLRSKLIY